MPKKGTAPLASAEQAPIQGRYTQAQKIQATKKSTKKAYRQKAPQEKMSLPPKPPILETIDETRAKLQYRYNDPLDDKVLEVWMFVRDNAMNLDSGRCCRKIREMILAVAQEPRKYVRNLAVNPVETPYLPPPGKITSHFDDDDE